MEYKFSNRALSAKPSRIREISARGAIDPEFISFAIGNPAYETFPVEEIRRCNDLIYERCPKYALQYGPTIGDDGFRELMKERFGILGDKEHTQKELADMMGISQSYISRLEKRIIAKIREQMKREYA